MKVVVSLTKNVLTPIAPMASSSAIYGVIKRKMCGEGVAIARKEIALFISNESMDDIIITINWDGPYSLAFKFYIIDKYKNP